MTAQPNTYRTIEKVYTRMNTFDVSEPEIKEIREYLPRGPGDVHYSDVEMRDGTRLRLFDIVSVVYSTPKTILPAENKIILPH